MPDFPLFPVDIPTLALSRALMQVMLAGLLVGVLQSVGAVLLGAEAAYGIVFVVMIAVLVLRPAGLLGQV